MSDVLPSITETIAMTALRGLILSVVGCEVIRGQVNRVAMPVGDFIELTPMDMRPLSTNVDTYNRPTQKVILRPTEWRVQVDCYGALAPDRSVAVSMLLRDAYACEYFAAAGIDMQPLYATEPHQGPLITGEAQYLNRWTFDAVLQINSVIALPQQFATALHVTTIEVDTTYPA